MFRVPVRGRTIYGKSLARLKSSSSFIRSTFIEFFAQKHGHKHVKSSSVVPLCDPTVPFVNAGMNQFKGVFLGLVEPPCARAVNSQKCVRVGGKHNDLEVVGSDGHHHTFFEMLGNWSFGDYYKKDACKMAWELLLGPYGFKPEDLVVTYFSGDAVLDLQEDRECRDIWKDIGVQSSRIKGLGASDNFWEMGATGPCGPCTEIHYVNPDGSLTEIWNIVFIQCNREADGSVTALGRHHVDTGLGLERVAALAQGARSNYDTDLFRPIIRAIERNSSGGAAYGGQFGAGAGAPRDAAYRRLADHARMLAVCLADGVFPATSLNLKQIMRKSFKISTDVFQNPQLLRILYDEVATSLGPTYPELMIKEKAVKLILEQEEQAYARMRAGLGKKWKELLARFPEVEAMADVEMSGFALGYKEFKEVMAKQSTPVIPGELVFKLYDTHGFQEDIIERIATLNNVAVDKEGFWKLLAHHKSRHKTAIKEQTQNKAQMFHKTIDELLKNKITSTNDTHKYKYTVVNNKVEFEALKTEIVAILNDEGEWLDFLEPIVNQTYYIVTKDTNFYCEEGGQIADSGVIRVSDSALLKVNSVFKIRDFVFHKGCFTLTDDGDYMKCKSDVLLEIDGEKRLSVMRNHTAVHLLNAAMRIVLPNSVVCQVGSSVTEQGLSLTLSVYGEKLSHDAVLKAQDLIRESIQSNPPVETRVVDSLQLDESVVTVPGESYPETGLRLVQIGAPLSSKELCCGTHVPSLGHVGQFCVTLVKAAAGHTPALHAITGPCAAEARELFCRAQQLYKVVDLLEGDRRKQEVATMRRQLSELCFGSGAPYAEYARCLALLDKVQKRALTNNDLALHAIAEEEIRDATLEATREGRRFVVHFLRCSYIMPSEAAARALRVPQPAAPTLLLGCAGGVIGAACTVPRELVTRSFTAQHWLRCVLPVFQAEPAPAPPGTAPDTYAEMTATKVSLITCEQLVQDAMRAAIKFAHEHTKDDHHSPGTVDGRSDDGRDRRQN